MQNRVDQSAVPTNVGLPLAFVANQSFNVLTKYQITDDIQVGGQATYRVENLRRHAVGCEPGHRSSELLAIRYVRRAAKSPRTGDGRLFVNNIFNKTYYDAFYQSAAPFTLVAPGRVVGVEMRGEVLNWLILI